MARSMILSTFTASVVPVIPLSIVLRSDTTPASTGLVTAEKITGVLAVRDIAACATGVVIATTTSCLSASKLCTIVGRLAISP